jgi:hypothetical protein
LKVLAEYGPVHAVARGEAKGARAQRQLQPLDISAIHETHFRRPSMRAWIFEILLRVVGGRTLVEMPKEIQP